MFPLGRKCLDLIGHFVLDYIKISPASNLVHFWTQLLLGGVRLTMANSPNEFLGTVGAVKRFKPWMLLAHQPDPCQGKEPKKTIRSASLE